MSDSFSYFKWMSNLLIQLNLSGANEEALIQAEHFAHSFPGYSLSEATYSDLLVLAGRSAEALTRIRRAALREPNSVELRSAEILIDLAMGARPQAFQKWREALRSTSTPTSLLFTTVLRALKIEDTTFAESILADFMVVSGGNDSITLSVQAFILAASGNVIESQDVLNQIPVKQIEELPLIYLLARAQFFAAAEYIADAQVYIRAFIDEANKRDCDLLSLSATLIYRLWTKATSQVSFIADQRSSWSFGEQLDMAIRSLMREGLYSQAYFQCRRLLLVEPERKELRLLTAETTFELGFHEKALQLLAQLTTEEQFSIRASKVRGYSLLKLERISELISFLNSPVADELRKSPTIFPLLDYLLSQNAFENVIQIIGSGEGLDPYSTILYNTQALVGLGLFDLAQRLAEASSQLDSCIPQTAVLLEALAKNERLTQKSPSLLESLKDFNASNASQDLFVARTLFSHDLPIEGLNVIANSNHSADLQIVQSLVQHPQRKRIERRDNVVVFVQLSSFRTRFAKMARALRKAGWHAVIVTNDMVSTIPEDCFDCVHRDLDFGHLLALISYYRPKVCHIGAWGGDRELLTLLREKIAKNVVDPTDYISGIITYTGCSSALLFQNESLKLADGLCARDLRPVVMKRDLNVPFPPHILYFPDYCWNEEGRSFMETERLEGIHAVSAGAIITKTQDDDMDHGYGMLAQKFAEHEIHLHIYPSELHGGSGGRLLEQHYGPLIELSRQNSYLHVHTPLQSTDVPAAIAKYHFGMHFLLPTLLGQTYHGFTKEAIARSGPARTADYIDAGLFICYNADSRFPKFLYKRTSSIGVPVDLDFLNSPRKPLEDKLNEGHFDRVTEFRKRFSTDAHVQRLINFYNSL